MERPLSKGLQRLHKIATPPSKGVAVHRNRVLVSDLVDKDAWTRRPGERPSVEG
jgi:hypothetical protein